MKMTTAAFWVLCGLLPWSSAMAQQPESANVPQSEEAAKDRVGPGGDTRIGTILGKPLFQRDRNPNVSLSDDVLRLFIHPLQKDYQRQHADARITDKEVAQFNHAQRIRHAAQLKEYQQKLARNAEQLKGRDPESKPYQELLQQKQVFEAVIKGARSPPSDLTYFLSRWKFQKHIYEHYGGGRILLSAFGPSAYDAQKKWLSECRKLKKYEAIDPEIRRFLENDRDEQSLGWRLTDDPDQVEAAFKPMWEQ